MSQALRRMIVYHSLGQSETIQEMSMVATYDPMRLLINLQEDLRIIFPAKAAPKRQTLRTPSPVRGTPRRSTRGKRGRDRAERGTLSRNRSRRAVNTRENFKKNRPFHQQRRHQSRRARAC